MTNYIVIAEDTIHWGFVYVFYCYLYIALIDYLLFGRLNVKFPYSVNVHNILGQAINLLLVYRSGTILMSGIFQCKFPAKNSYIMVLGMKTCVHMIGQECLQSLF